MAYCVTDVNRLKVNSHLRSYPEVDIIAKFFTIKNWLITYTCFQLVTMSFCEMK